ncbi:hypothetical protein GI374_03345 [Paracoccus sp. S-4012]|uniref:hypothetical protein n=1 Tax=Paracoccus sp. S-4012 TaxID=2665648 RepID=UPI0012B0D9D6|nr:hypothetical protein [Paracoccus sp. S-4012]MRX49493.1 hypothetical protein [Paracoccus sp. S-4012]
MMMRRGGLRRGVQIKGAEAVPRRRSISLTTLLAVAGVAALIAMLTNRNAPRRHRDQSPSEGGRAQASSLAAIHPDVAADAGEAADACFVRPAGPEAMRDAPRRGWDRTDEASDESFPASDPPGNY